MTDDITILIPTYNRRKFLPLILRNIYAQDYDHQKLKVLIDDDGTEKLFINDELDMVREEIKPIEIIYNHSSIKKTIGKKRNDLIKLCTTKIFAFMDDDDIYMPTYISHSYKTLKDNNAGCVGCDKMLFCMTFKEFGIYALSCGDNINMIHEATIMATKKWFKGSCKFKNNSEGEGQQLFAGQNNTVAITEITKLMICIQHKENTICKKQFSDDKYKVDLKLDNRLIDLIKMIEKILNQYKNKKTKEKERYDMVKDTEEFKTLSRERTKNYYIKNKDKKAQNYENNKTMIKAKNSYNYYKKTNNIEKFKTKHSERYNILLISGYIME